MLGGEDSNDTDDGDNDDDDDDDEDDDDDDEDEAVANLLLLLLRLPLRHRRQLLQGRRLLLWRKNGQSLQIATIAFPVPSTFLISPSWSSPPLLQPVSYTHLTLPTKRIV